MTPFAGFSKVDWARYEDEGSAPRLSDLLALGSPKSPPAAVRRARRSLETAIYDQGCASPITTATVPFLLEVLGGKPTALAKASVLSLLCDILTDDEDFVFERFSLRGKLVDGIRRGKRTYERLLADGDADVRAQAARILAYHPGTGAALAKRCGVEKDPYVLATVLIAAAMQKQRPKIVSKDARVRTCAAMAALLTGGKLDDELADTLIAALDDKKIDGGVAFFHHGNLREAAAEALGRFGRRNEKVIDALVDRRKSEAKVAGEHEPRALGRVAVEALARIAVAKEGKLDAAGKKIVTRILDVSPGWALARRGLSADPDDLAKLLGVKTERPSALEGKLRDAVLAVVVGDVQYEPAAIVARLGAIEPVGARVDAVFDLLRGRDGLDDNWSYGKVKKRGGWRSGEERVVLRRRLARLHDVCLRVLRGAGSAIASRLDAELDALRTACEAARKSGARTFERYTLPIQILSIARAAVHVAANEPVPEALRRPIADQVTEFAAVAPHVKPLLPALGAAFMDEITNQGWWYLDNPEMLRVFVAWAQSAPNKDWLRPPHDIAPRVLREVDPTMLEPILREVAKSKRGAHELAWKTPGGETLVIRTNEQQVLELDQVF
jgi:hypothetical protein